MLGTVFFQSIPQCDTVWATTDRPPITVWELGVEQSNEI